MRRSPADQPVVAVKSLLAGVGVERRGWLIRNVDSINRVFPGRKRGNMPTSQVKPFDIPKQMVWEAYRRVAANKGAPGVDEVTMDEFESDLKNNLYKIWNRMSSGSYFPPPVKGGRDTQAPRRRGPFARCAHDRRPGGPNGGGHALEERAEPRFHPDSYGYRPKRPPTMRSRRAESGAGDRTGSSTSMSRSSSIPCRGTSSKRRSKRSTDTPWVLLYVKRWLAAPLQLQDGTLVERDNGTPQGSAVSPILANLFMHFAFDTWMDRNFPDCPWSAMPTMRSCTV